MATRRGNARKTSRQSSPVAVSRVRSDERKSAASTEPKRADTTPKRASIDESKTGKKAKRDKVIRDSFTMPLADYAMIATLKKRCVALGVAMKKSELLRAGIAVLEQMPDDRLAQAVSAVASVKTGRPPGKKDKARKKDRKESR